MSDKKYTAETCLAIGEELARICDVIRDNPDFTPSQIRAGISVAGLTWAMLAMAPPNEEGYVATNNPGVPLDILGLLK